MAIQLNRGFILRRIGPQYMAVPYGAMSARVGGMITLSESGFHLWRALEQGSDSEEALAALLTERYEVDAETALCDVRAFLAYLSELGAVAV